METDRIELVAEDWANVEAVIIRDSHVAAYALCVALQGFSVSVSTEGDAFAHSFRKIDEGEQLKVESVQNGNG